MRANRLPWVVLLLSASCSDSELAVSKGLKIFVTSGVHGADFANDPFLSGAGAIEKADAFCNSDPARPSAATYKALLVDGVNRDARTLVDWVLKPSTAYYRAHGDVLIGTTTPTAIFGAAYQPLAHSIGEPSDPFRGPTGPTFVWTGIGNAADFASGDNCSGWSDLAAIYGETGMADQTNGWAFGGGGATCSGFQVSLYCVEQ